MVNWPRDLISAVNVLIFSFYISKKYSWIQKKIQYFFIDRLFVSTETVIREKAWRHAYGRQASRIALTPNRKP
jgi:hypothetical protein